MRREFGPRVAATTARRMVVPPQRAGGQAQFVRTPVPACDAETLGPLLGWVLENLDLPHTVDSLAKQATMSPRTFARRFRSETGHAVATAIHAELTPVLPGDGEVCGKAYAALRETRMPAVVCELVPDTDVDAMRSLVFAAADVGRAIVRGVQKGIEEPAVD